MLKLFVSHAWHDKVQPQFGSVYTELKGYDLWIDKSEITPGSSIKEKIVVGIREAEVVIVLWSAAAAASESVRFEMATALAEGKLIVPCLLDDTSLAPLPGAGDRLAIDMRTPRASPVGWRKLRYFLMDVCIKKIEGRISLMADARSKAQMEADLLALRQWQQGLGAQISALQDTDFRMGAGASDRDARNPYMLNMVHAIEASIPETAAAADLQLKKFMQYIPTVFGRLPDDDAESVALRRSLFQTRLRELDPASQNARLQQVLALLG
jgi:hypothetical protein